MNELHTMKIVDAELRELGELIAEMARKADKMLVDAVNALIRGDIRLARLVIDSDVHIDSLQHQIEENAVVEIARRQPVACDLRELVSTFGIVGELERVGDLAKNIAKRAVKIGPREKPSNVSAGLKRMAEIASASLSDVVDAYIGRDAAGAKSVWLRDAELDALDDLVVRNILTRMMEDRASIAVCSHLLFCSKNIERIGDHATNVAEAVYYIITGDKLPDDRPRGRLEVTAPSAASIG